MYKKILAMILLAVVPFGLCACSFGNEQNTQNVHAFSVGDNKQVYFAKSNLQYCPETGVWSFAENAYDTIGQDNENISSTYSGKIDLFAWGATGADIAPYCTDTDNANYGNGHNSIAGTEMDFGVAIASQVNGNYRMFTNNEIHYLLMFRKNADKLFGYGTIDGVKGLFILPDDWEDIEGITFVSAPHYGFENQYNWYWTIGDKENYVYNNYSANDWGKMEAGGAVFLPVTGLRYDNEMSHVGISGHYWTSSNYGEEFANCLCLFEHDLFLEGNFDRCYGLAIRLVQDIA